MKSKKKLLIGAAALLLLGAILAAVWVGCDWPPPRLILKYGFPPAGGPTGRTAEISGLKFIELAPGFRWARVPPHELVLRDSIGNKLRRRLFGSAPLPSLDIQYPNSRWIDLDQPIWISEDPVRWGTIDFEVDPAQVVSELQSWSRARVKALQEFCARGTIRVLRLPEWIFAFESWEKQSPNSELEVVIGGGEDGRVLLFKNWHLQKGPLEGGPHHGSTVGMHVVWAPESRD